MSDPGCHGAHGIQFLRLQQLLMPFFVFRGFRFEFGRSIFDALVQFHIQLTDASVSFDHGHRKEHRGDDPADQAEPHRRLTIFAVHMDLNNGRRFRMGQVAIDCRDFEGVIAGRQSAVGRLSILSQFPLVVETTQAVSVEHCVGTCFEAGSVERKSEEWLG